MKRNLGLILCLAGTLCAARGGVVLSDDFTYPDGGIITNSTWIPNTGTANSMLVSNGQLVVSTARTEDMVRLLAGQPYRTNGPVAALYSAFTLKCVGKPTLLGTYFAHFTGTNINGLGGHRARLFSMTTNANAGLAAGNSQFYIGVVNAGGNPTNGTWATALETNVTYTIVTRYILATGESTLWVNPTQEGDASVTANDILPYEDPSNPPTAGVLNVSMYGFRQATGEGTLLIDNLKVGTRFNDIAGTNTSPLISVIADQAIAGNSSTGPLSFQVQDAESAADSLQVTASSDNTVLVPNNQAALALSGSGGNRIITVTPTPGQQGTANIEVRVTDGVNTSFTTFQVRVGFPSISSIPNQLLNVGGTTGPVPFTVGDQEGDPLTVSVESTNSALVATTDVSFGGTGANRTITVTPQAGQSGITTLTVKVSDGINEASTSFVVTVRPTLGILFSDTFSYADGSLWLSGGWSEHASPTGTNFGQLQVVGGAAQMSYRHAEDLAASLAGAPYAPASGAVLYTGFLIRFTDLPSASGNYFLHLKDSSAGTSFRSKVFAGTANAGTGQYRIGVAKAANNVSAQYPMDLSLNNTYLVVTRYSAGSADTRLWVNPVSESSPSVDATDVTPTSTIGAIGLRQDAGIGTNYVDNLVVSGNFADVLSAFPSPQPEPLVINQTPNGLELKWTNPLFRLQAAPAVTGTFTNVANATSPFIYTGGGDRVYFRLKY